MITLEVFENTIDFILNKYNSKYYYDCMMSKNNFKYFIWSKYSKYMIKLLPTTDIKINGIYFSEKLYLKNNDIKIFSGPIIAQIDFLTDNERIIKEIIE